MYISCRLGGDMRNSPKTESFEKRLRAYAAGAGAAAGLLALSPPADAEVVVVPAHVTIGIDGYFPIIIEGTTEFTLFYKFYEKYGWSGSLLVDATLGASVVGLSGQDVALRFGQAIGPQHQFEAGQQILAKASELRYRYNTWGPFANTYQRFLGLRFKLNGQVHYGWAGFSAVT